MHISTEIRSAPRFGETLGDARMRLRTDGTRDCDFCGRPVRHESASERIHRGDDGVEIVVLCRECDLGKD